MFRLKIAFCFLLVFTLHTCLTLFKPLSLERFLTIVVPKGSSLKKTVAILAENSLLKNRTLVVWGLRAAGYEKSLLSGFYDVSPGSTPFDVIRQLAKGETAKRRIVIEAGSSKYKIVDKINSHPDFTGRIDDVLLEELEEGAFFPDTYVFDYGLDRVKFLSLLQEKMNRFLKEAWVRKSEGVLVESPREVLILASIVEKEANNREDMCKVAAVFMNRLQKGMRLQSDVTMAYSLDLGKGRFRAPTSEELKINNQYNTYRVSGLPPHPITNPSAAALEAVIKPCDNTHLFFFADKKGVNHFSGSFKEHKEGIRRFSR